MNYELAKQLSDAGFSQDVPEWRSGPEIGLVDDEGKTDEQAILDTMVYDPTLSELIEACGSNFKSLNKEAHFDYWHASTLGKKAVKVFATGRTPEEAVAKLWLKLNSPMRD